MAPENIYRYLRSYFSRQLPGITPSTYGPYGVASTEGVTPTAYGVTPTDSGIAPSAIPLIILDTSGILDLELAYRRDPAYNYRQAHAFLDHLTETAAGVRFLVPESVKRETETHHFYHVRNGRPEVSAATLGRVKDLPSTYSELEQFVSENENAVDFVRLYARLLQCSDMRGKKAEQDCISSVDLDVVYNALTAGLLSHTYEHTYEKIPAQAPEGTGEARRRYRVAVLSSDQHVNWLLREIRKYPWGVGLSRWVEPVEVREHLE